MSVVVIDPMKDTRWDEFVRRHRHGHFFHLTPWQGTLAKSFHYTPYCPVVLDGQGRIVAGIPFMSIRSRLTGARFVSLPRTPFCEPLVDADEDLEAILDHLEGAVSSGQIDYFEIRTRVDCEPLSRRMKGYQPFINQWLSFPNDGEKGRDKRKPQTVKRVEAARLRGVRVRIVDRQEDLDVFYDLHTRVAKRHLIPNRPYGFFQELWKACAADGLLVLLIVELNAVPIGAVMAFRYKNRLHAEFGGTNYDYIDEGPNYTLYQEEIELAMREGLRFIDYGVTPIENKGLARFKRQWGCKERPVHYYYYPDVKGYKRSLVAASESEGAEPGVLGKAQGLMKRWIASRLYGHFG